MDSTDITKMIQESQNDDDALWEHRLRRKEVAGDAKRFAQLREQEKAEVDEKVKSLIEEYNTAATLLNNDSDDEDTKDYDEISYEKVDTTTPKSPISDKAMTFQNVHVHIQNLTINL